LKQTAHYVLDFRDTITPLALLKMTQVLKEMEADEVLEIITRDPDVRTDVLKIIPASTCELIHMELSENADLCRIQLKKSRQCSRP
jgi:TusA-related sulfurtransferase